MTKPYDQDPRTPSDELVELWKRFTEADERSTAGAKKKEALKADYDALAKASEEITQVVDAYRKSYLQLFDQANALKQFAGDKRYSERVPEDRRNEIDRAVDEYVGRVRRVEGQVSRPGYGNDLEEEVQKYTVEFEGMKRHADLHQRWFDKAKAAPKDVEDRHKAWAELRGKAEKAYAEQKYERAYFCAALLARRIARQEELDHEKSPGDRSAEKKPGEKTTPIPPAELRARLVQRWQVLRRARAEVSEARGRFDEAAANLERGRKQLDQLFKTGVEEVIRDLDLDPPERLTVAGQPATTA